MTSRGIESGLSLISLSNTYKMVGIMEVQFREDGDSLEEFKGRGQDRQGVLVVNGDGVKSLIINTSAEGPIILYCAMASLGGLVRWYRQPWGEVAPGRRSMAQC